MPFVPHERRQITLSRTFIVHKLQVWNNGGFPRVRREFAFPGVQSCTNKSFVQISSHFSRPEKGFDDFTMFRFGGVQ
jgi:hypothetical protein